MGSDRVEAGVPTNGLDDSQAVIELKDVVKEFKLHGRRGPGAHVVRAVEGVSFGLQAGRVTALVGESGSGKSTIARLIAQLHPLTAGSVMLNGRAVARSRGRRYRRYARRVQMIFQDPFSSLNPVHKVRHHLERPLRIHRLARSSSETKAALRKLLDDVNLTPPEQYLDKFPHELSGGQRQRVAIARALAVEPEVLIADEPVSMLDVSIRLGVLNLLSKLATERRLALLYITHDIASARYFATTTLVMYAGQLIEGGPSEAVTQSPAHPYSQLLISSAPDAAREEQDAVATAPRGEPPSLSDPPPGCRFHPRCPFAMKVCQSTPPPRSELGGGHWTRCWIHVEADVDREPLDPTLASSRRGQISTEREHV